MTTKGYVKPSRPSCEQSPLWIGVLRSLTIGPVKRFARGFREDDFLGSVAQTLHSIGTKRMLVFDGTRELRSRGIASSIVRGFCDVQETALLIRLLKYATTEWPQDAAARDVRLLEGVDDREIQWALDAGLGPLLYRASRDSVLVDWRDALLSADLTARVRHGNLVDTAKEVVDICQEMQICPTLLKGISISDQHYPVAHLRPMGDIDVLIPADSYGSVEAALLRRGYLRKPDFRVSRGARHGVPLAHPERRTWVELHTALFDDDSLVDSVFRISNVTAQCVPSTFHGRRVYRLANELQLLYIASCWIGDLARYDIEIHPSCVPPLLDVLFLLKASRKELDHSRLAVGAGSETALASLYVMLAYLARHGLDQESHRLSRVLASGQRIVGPLQLEIIHAVLDRYLIGGRLWNVPLPLPVPGRYSARHQLRKRLRGARH